MRPLRFYFLIVIWGCSSLTIQAGDNPFDQYVPSSALIYKGYDDTLEHGTPMPNYEKAIENWSVLMDDILEWHVLKGEIQSLVDQFNVQEGFQLLQGKKRCWAFMPIMDDLPIPGVGLYITDVDDPQKTDQVLTALFQEIEKLFPQLRTIKDEYYGYWIRSLYGPTMLPGLDLAYTFKGNTIFVSNSKPLLLKIIDDMEDKEEFLPALDIYQEAMVDLPRNRSSVLFVNLHKISESSDNILKNMKALQKLEVAKDLQEVMPLIEGALGFLGSLKSYASVRTLDSDNRVNITAHTRFNLDIQSEEIKEILDREPVPFQFERYLPRNVGAVTAQNLVGPRDVWTIFQNVLPSLPEADHIQKLIEDWEEESEFSIEKDILSWMGDSWCIMRPVMDLDTVVATNQGAVLFEIKDPQAAKEGIQKLIDLLLEEYKLPLVSDAELYLDTDIHTITLPIPLVPVAPSWSIHENVLMVASRPNMIREMLDIDAGVRSGIQRNRQYRYLRDAAIAPANKVSFQDNESEFYAFREAMRKVGSIPEVYALPEELRFLPSFILDRVSYLMSCFQILRGTVKRSVVESHQITSHNIQLIRDLRAVPPIDYVRRQKISLGLKDGIAAWADSCSGNEKQRDRAIRLYTALHDFFPENSEYIYRLGDIYKKMGNLDQALNLFDQVLKTSPRNVFLVARETLIDNSTTEDIVHRVRTLAGQTQRINANATLFGIAMQKRNSHPSVASGLLEYLTQPGVDVNLAQAARMEKSLLENRIPPGVIRIQNRQNAPAVDGWKKDEEWNEADSFLLTMGKEIGDASATMYMQTDATHLYVLVEDNNPGRKDTINIYICPSRDYLHVNKMSITMENSDLFTSNQVAMNPEVYDPYDLVVKPKQHPKLNLPKVSQDAPPWLKKLSERFYRGIIEDQQPSTGSIQAAWRLNKENHQRVLEIAIPYSVLSSKDLPVKSVWLMNVNLTRGHGDEQQVLSLSGTDHPDQLFSYKVVQVR